MRVALVLHATAPSSSQALLANVVKGLRDAGQEPTVVAAHPLAEGILRRRGFTGPLTQVPITVQRLWARQYDVAHAFSAPDALAALLWRRLSGRPVVFHCIETLDRDRLADRRLRLRLLTAAVEEADAVVASTPEARSALARWLAVDAALIDLSDGVALVRLYRELLGQT